MLCTLISKERPPKLLFSYVVALAVAVLLVVPSIYYRSKMVVAVLVIVPVI